MLFILNDNLSMLKTEFFKILIFLASVVFNYYFLIYEIGNQWYYDV